MSFPVPFSMLAPRSGRFHIVCHSPSPTHLYRASFPVTRDECRTRNPHTLPIGFVLLLVLPKNSSSSAFCTRRDRRAREPLEQPGNSLHFRRANVEKLNYSSGRCLADEPVGPIRTPAVRRGRRARTVKFGFSGGKLRKKCDTSGILIAY